MAAPIPRADESPGVSVANAVRDDILAGTLTAGERLIEEALAQQYGVSRVPVREALAQLESEGFVTIVRYRGATVSKTLVKDSRELLQVRRGLEILAAQLAAESKGGTVADELRSIARHTGAASRPFHELTAIASGNQHLRDMLANINRRVGWGLGHNPEASTTDHATLAVAILDGSVVQAGYLMDEHLRRDERYFVEKFGSE